MNYEQRKNFLRKKGLKVDKFEISDAQLEEIRNLFIEANSLAQWWAKFNDDLVCCGSGMDCVNVSEFSDFMLDLIDTGALNGIDFCDICRHHPGTFWWEVFLSENVDELIENLKKSAIEETIEDGLLAELELLLSDGDNFEVIYDLGEVTFVDFYYDERDRLCVLYDLDAFDPLIDYLLEKIKRGWTAFNEPIIVKEGHFLAIVEYDSIGWFWDNYGEDLEKDLEEDLD